MTIGRLLLAVEADGAGVHPAAWRYPGAAETATDPRLLKATATAGERAGFAFVTFDDGPIAPPAGARIEAGTCSRPRCPTSWTRSSPNSRIAAFTARNTRARHSASTWPYRYFGRWPALPARPAECRLRGARTLCPAVAGACGGRKTGGRSVQKDFKSLAERALVSRAPALLVADNSRGPAATGDRLAVDRD